MFAERLVKIALAGSLAVALLAGQAAAQTQHEQPYAGLQSREIKALSGEEMSDLRAGRGMGLALAAELNGYPGPRHVLDLASQLSLSDEQRARIQQMFDSMREEAIPLGKQLVAAEKDLNRAFAERTINPERLQAMTAAIAEKQGELRNSHLKYHLATAALLNPDQLRRYGELRGYAGGASSPNGSAGATAGSPHAAMGESGHPHMMESMHGH
jgi:Spy/CpxP family protein refolding chaperone